MISSSMKYYCKPASSRNYDTPLYLKHYVKDPPSVKNCSLYLHTNFAIVRFHKIKFKARTFGRGMKTLDVELSQKREINVSVTLSSHLVYNIVISHLTHRPSRHLPPDVMSTRISRNRHQPSLYIPSSVMYWTTCLSAY